ncbi:uncharacterized protein TNCV_2240631 [Trichonephila clavipes]|nr:uncharacterized protein TNCV_2240631 [Trichonephila clavipes]
MGGRGRLTDAEIDKLQRYYGLGIRNNTDNINSMKRVIWATYFHKTSTDAYLQHALRPTNEDTCCGYNREITTGEVYKHKNTSPSEVLYCIKYVYRELSTPNLLAICLHDFYAAGAMEAADRKRLRKANYDIFQNSKEARVKGRHKKCILEDTLEEERNIPKFVELIENKPKEAYNKIFTEADERYLVRIVKVNPFLIAPKLAIIAENELGKKS